MRRKERMKEQESRFLKEMERRLDENRRLKEREFLPSFLTQAGSVVGLYPWQVLFLGSLVLAGLVFVVADGQVWMVLSRLFFIQ